MSDIHQLYKKGIMSADKGVLKDIPDEKPVRIFLPIQDSEERYRANCIYKVTDPPRFQLVFPAGVLPAESLDQKSISIINVDMGGPTLSLEAKITEIVNNQTLDMIVHKTISHDQMRDFFRVDATTKVISKSFHPEFFGKNNAPWSLHGRTIDISGSGLLASFGEEPPKDDQVRLEITLPTSPPEAVKVLAHPVRTTQVADNQWDVAYQFDDITDEDRDKIIGCCLVIQRRMLRLKVQIRDHDKI